MLQSLQNTIYYRKGIRCNVRFAQIEVLIMSVNNAVDSIVERYQKPSRPISLSIPISNAYEIHSIFHGNYLTAIVSTIHCNYLK